MSTKDAIIKLGDRLIRDKGFNAFSFYDLSAALQLKNASIHYYFPTKADLGLSILEDHRSRLQRIISDHTDKSPRVRLNAFLSTYSQIQAEGAVCLVGSLATDLKTVEPRMAESLKAFAREILTWVTSTLEEGREKKVFQFDGKARTKALMIITNMLAALQLSRLTNQNDFEVIRKEVLNSLNIKK